MARLCKEPGCDKTAHGRGMCSFHWRKWARANPDIRQQPTTLKTVEEALPGTHAQIVAETGYCSPTVTNSLPLLKDQGRAHIGGWQPPTTMGTRWLPVWVAGPGRDAVLTKQQRHAQECKSNRQSAARRKSVGWAAPLMVA